GDLEEAGAAVAGGMGDHARASRHRRADRRPLRVLRRRRARDPPSSRALGRLRLSRRTGPREHPTRGAHCCRGRRLRRAHLGALLPRGACTRRGARVPGHGGRSHARRDGGGRAARRAPPGRALSMYAIARPWEPRPGGLLSGAPLPLLVALGVLTAGAGALARAELVPLAPARALGAGGAQGALLATAVAWAASRGGPAPWLAATVVLAGAVGAALSPLGALAYLAAPVWVCLELARLPGLGLARAPAGLVVAGAALGALLGAHLFVTASLPLGYSGRVPTLEGLAPWLAYDVGGNVLTTEAFFRGALFDRAQRRWPFPAAAALVTALCLVRYLVDPLLPRSLEVTAGAVFYLTLLSLANCWL